ncbi:MAG TPA: hypothetical protein VGF67_00885 [Ktedonobacteraceae bacterium]
MLKEEEPVRLPNVGPQLTSGKFSQTETWNNLYAQIISGIQKCEWPEHTGLFTLYDKKQGNGVKPIKDPCMKYLKSRGWALEAPSRVATAIRSGNIDAAFTVENKLFCVEWETGNISSSHRSLNKLALGLIQGDFIGEVLIVPSRAMYYYLTDRIGNIRELEPYFPIFQAIRILEGILAIVVIEHDQVSTQAPPIPKGNDGSSLIRRESKQREKYGSESHGSLQSGRKNEKLVHSGKERSPEHGNGTNGRYSARVDAYATHAVGDPVGQALCDPWSAQRTEHGRTDPGLVDPCAHAGPTIG